MPDTRETPLIRFIDLEQVEMALKSVEGSSSISKLGFLATETFSHKLGRIRVGWLLVEFVAGGRYAYKDAPEPVMFILEASESTGKAFHRFVRDRYEVFKLS